MAAVVPNRICIYKLEHRSEPERFSPIDRDIESVVGQVTVTGTIHFRPRIDVFDPASCINARLLQYQHLSNGLPYYYTGMLSTGVYTGH